MSVINKEIYIIGEKNPRGIPKAIFVNNIEEFLKKYSFTPESLIEQMNELYQKYKYMERRLTTTKSQLKLKVPEIEKTLDMENDEDIETYYSLADNVYSKATIDKTGTVCIWLGANVMVEYTYDEAISLLNDNLEAATNRLKDTNEDLGFIRDQSITLEVNMARVYNYDVRQRRKLKQQQS